MDEERIRIDERNWVKWKQSGQAGLLVAGVILIMVAVAWLYLGMPTTRSGLSNAVEKVEGVPAWAKRLLRDKDNAGTGTPSR